MTSLLLSAALLLASDGAAASSTVARQSSSTVVRPGAVASAAHVEAANRAAIREPDRDAFVNAVQVYPWNDGTIYRLYATPERVSDIALQPGEALIAVAAGDTVRWIVGDTSSGAGETLRTHILVKPSVPGLRTNLVITTNRRAYHLDLESTARTAMAGIAWRYPQDELLAVQRAAAVADAALPVAQGVDVETLNFNYAIEGDAPVWRPVRAFDDGRQLFIEFPSSLAQADAPPLFVTGANGGVELVNYRVRGRYYIVDRIFAAGELRLGGRKQEVVRITRTGHGSKRLRNGRQL